MSNPPGLVIRHSEISPNYYYLRVRLKIPFIPFPIDGDELDDDELLDVAEEEITEWSERVEYALRDEPVREEAWWAVSSLMEQRMGQLAWEAAELGDTKRALFYNMTKDGVADARMKANKINQYRANRYTLGLLELEPDELKPLNVHEYQIPLRRKKRRMERERRKKSHRSLSLRGAPKGLYNIPEDEEVGKEEVKEEERSETMEWNGFEDRLEDPETSGRVADVEADEEEESRIEDGRRVRRRLR